MRPPIRLEDIEEFEPVYRVPRAAITDGILEGVRLLYEETEIEPFLREILPDPTQTPHTSTETVDILTTHVTYSGQPRLAAFINKGRSSHKVTAKNVSNQIFRLRRIPNLGLAVLLAVGNIQDDAKEHFLQTAIDASADYMVVDAVDVARLFIAHHKICPRDGTPYTDGRCRKCGVTASEPIDLMLKVYEEPRYHILSSQDISSRSAKRYRADVLTDPHYSKATLREIIKKATWELRRDQFYRSERARDLFGDQDADCVFLFVFLDISDMQQRNWICRTSWTSLDLPESAKPLQFDSDEQLGEIRIDWSTNYHQMRDYWLSNVGSKGEWVQKIEVLFPRAEDLTMQAEELLSAYTSCKIGKDQLEIALEELEAYAEALFFEAGDRKLPPLDYEECDSVFYAMVGNLHNAFLPFSKSGRATWTWKQRLWLVERYLQSYTEDKDRFLHEWQKVH